VIYTVLHLWCIQCFICDLLSASYVIYSVLHMWRIQCFIYDVFSASYVNWSLSRVFIPTFWFNSITWVESSDSTWILESNLLTQLNINLESEFNSSSWFNSLSNRKWCQMSRFTIFESITSLYLKDFRATNEFISLLIVCIILLHYQ